MTTSTRDGRRLKTSDEQVKSRWESLKSRQRLETAIEIANFAVGRSVSEIGRLIERSRRYIMEHLDLYGFTYTLKEGVAAATPAVWGKLTRNEVRAVIRTYSPRSANPDEVEYWLDQGFLTDAATRLAIAGEAAERAMDAGVIHANVDSELEIKRPWEVDCRSHCARVVAAARFLNEAQIANLKRASTREAAVQAHVIWMEQIDRLRNFHGDFDERVAEAWKQ